LLKTCYLMQVLMILLYKDNEINDNGLPQHFTNLDRNKDYKEDYSSDLFIYIATKY